MAQPKQLIFLNKISTFSPNNQFWLKLAYLNVTPLRCFVEEHHTRAAALAAMGREKEAVLLHGGYAVPAKVNFEHSTVDAGGFQAADHQRNLLGVLLLTYPQKQLTLEVGYTPEDGWYPTKAGVQKFRQEVLACVSLEAVAAAMQA